MDALLNAFAGMLGKISDPVNIILILGWASSEYLRITQSKEHNKDRNEVLLPALRQMTEELNDIKNAISAMTGRPM